MELKSTIAYRDFEKLDIRVGTITIAESVPDSKKLLKLIVNFGDHEKQVIAGIAKEYSDPAVLIGKQAIFLVNLEPRKLAGLESQAMLLAAGTLEDGPAILQADRPMPPGCEIH